MRISLKAFLVYVTAATFCSVFAFELLRDREPLESKILGLSGANSSLGENNLCVRRNLDNQQFQELVYLIEKLNEPISLLIVAEKISDEGLQVLKDAKNIHSVELWGSNCSETGIAELDGAVGLKLVTLSKSTAIGLPELRRLGEANYSFKVEPGNVYQ